jgi:hypothetical protein
MNNTCDTAGGPASNGAGNIAGGVNISTNETLAVTDYVTVKNNIFSNLSGESAITERVTSGGRLGPHNDFTSNLFFQNAVNWSSSEILYSPQSICGSTAVCSGNPDYADA